MNEDYQNNISTTLHEVEAKILNDLGVSSGVNPEYAQAFSVLHAAWMGSAMQGSTGPTPLDAYVTGIISGLARVLTTDVRSAATLFDTIAAHAIGGAAHIRTALQRDTAAKGAPDAPAAPDAPLPPATPSQSVGNFDFDGALAKLKAEKAQEAQVRTGQNAAPPVVGQTNSVQTTDTAPAPAPQDPREAAPGAYSGDVAEVKS